MLKRYRRYQRPPSRWGPGEQLLLCTLGLPAVWTIEDLADRAAAADPGRYRAKGYAWPDTRRVAADLYHRRGGLLAAGLVERAGYRGFRLTGKGWQVRAELVGMRGG